MEINVVASRNYIVNFVNDYLQNNDLIFFNDKNFETNGIVLSNEINLKDFNEKDILINIGTKKILI